TEVMSGSKSAVGLLDASTLEAPLPAPGQEPVPPIFHGSISERIVSVPRAPSAAGAPPPAATQPPTPDTTPPPVIISGTKSFIVDFGPLLVPPPAPPSKPETPPPATPKPSGRSE